MAAAAEQKDQLQVSSSLDKVNLLNKEMTVNLVNQKNKEVLPYKNMPTKFSNEGSFELDVKLTNNRAVIEMPENFATGFNFVAYPIGGDRLFIVKSKQELLNAIKGKPKILKLRIGDNLADVVINDNTVFDRDEDIVTVDGANEHYRQITNNKAALYDDPDTLIKASSTSPEIEKFRSIAHEIEQAEILKEKEKLLRGGDGNYVKRIELAGIRDALKDEDLFKQLILGLPKP